MAQFMRSDRVWVAGVDGCRGGWLVVLRQPGTPDFCYRLLKSFKDVLALPETPLTLAVDMPVGLLNAAQEGGRDCDRVARVLLRDRGCCVFSPPVRAALRCGTYELACKTNAASSSIACGISRQAFGLIPKLLEVDECLTPELQSRVFEAHPELSFYELNHRTPMAERKKSSGGFSARRRLFEGTGFGNVIEEVLAAYPRKHVARDDVLDACVCSWTAERLWRKTALRIPEPPPRDSRRLRMEVWR
jgi:predicted RNase H-like nuclease